MLQAKIQRLEHLLNLKDIRIEELSNKVEQLTMPTFQGPPPRRGQQKPAGAPNYYGSHPQLASQGGRY